MKKFRISLCSKDVGYSEFWIGGTDNLAMKIASSMFEMGFDTIYSIEVMSESFCRVYARGRELR
jgi:hypothetical protein